MAYNSRVLNQRALVVVTGRQILGGQRQTLGLESQFDRRELIVVQGSGFDCGQNAVRRIGQGSGSGGGAGPAVVQFRAANQRVVLGDELLERGQRTGLADFVPDSIFFSLHRVADACSWSATC